MRTIVQRLKPDEEIIAVIEALCLAHKIEAGTILSMVGSVKNASLRFANQTDAAELRGPFEIVSATGTVGVSGCHIHMAVADNSGTTLGGHMLPGALVYTTVELVILDLSESCSFSRSPCTLSGFEELVVQEK